MEGTQTPVLCIVVITNEFVIKNENLDKVWVFKSNFLV
jgi:hypothetical protein